MKRQPVTSSNLASAGYDQASKTLEVEFTNGTVYSYAAVPVETYNAFLMAPSKGSYFSKFIRGKFESTKVGP